MRSPSSPLTLFALLLCACRPELPNVGADDPKGRVELVVEPATPSRVVHLRLRGAAELVAAGEVVLVSGTLGDRQLHDLSRGTPSQSLLERSLPLSVFARGSDLWALPHSPFADGTFTFAVPSLGLTEEIDVSAEAEPALWRVFPASGQPSTNGVAVYCGLAGPATAEQATFLPDGPSGMFRDGLRDGDGSGCLRFEPDAVPGEGVAQPPLRAAGALLDPSPLELAETASAEAVTCRVDERRVGAACLFVDDDRLLVRAPREHGLWGLSVDGAPSVVAATNGAFPIAMTGLRPAQTFTLRVDAASLRGPIFHEELALTTKVAHPHVVINEVYANPVGLEPEQEWVELFNSGAVEVALEELVLRDPGGDTALPPGVVLPPGAFALIVNEGFDPLAAYDVGPAPETRIVRLAKLGTNGLSNAGEPLELVDGAGQTLDAFPPAPKPKSGVSVGRVYPDVVPEDSAGFVRFETPTPGWANAASPDAEE